MTHEGGPESTQQRTVAELLAKYGEQSGERAPRRRRRRPDETTDTAPQTIIERVNSESSKIAPIREDTPPPRRTSHRQQRSGSHQQPSGQHPVPPTEQRQQPEARRQAPAPPPPAESRPEPRQPSPLEQRLSPQSRSVVPPVRREPPPAPPPKQAPPSLPPAPQLPAIAHSEPTRPVQQPRRVRRAAPAQPSGTLAQPTGAHPQPTGSHPQPTGQHLQPPQAAAPAGAPPVQNSGTFVRPPAPPEPGPPSTGYFAPPAQPREEGVTEQLPKIPAGPGSRTGQQPAPFPPARANFGQLAPAPEQQRNGAAPAPDLDDGADPRYPDDDEFDGESYDDDGFDDDRFDDDEPRRSSPGRDWLVMAGQVAISVVGGAAVWLGFNWLWDKLPQAALAAAIAVIVGLVWIVRKIRRADDLQTTGLAVLVGLFVTVSPAALILLSK